jgi:hypothetical protein
MLSMAHQLLHVWTCVCILYISVWTVHTVH